MKRLALCIVLSLTSLISLQVKASNKIDSLFAALKKANHDSTKIQIYLNIGEVFYLSSPDSAIFYYAKALELADSYSFSKNDQSQLKSSILPLKAKALRNIGDANDVKGNFNQAIKFCQESLKISEGLNDKLNISHCLKDIGVFYAKMGNYYIALEYNLKALKLFEAIGNKKGIAACYNFIGNIYLFQNNFTKALSYYFKAMEIKEKINDANGIAICSSNISEIYTSLHNYDLAIKYNYKSLKAREELGDIKGVAICYDNMGELQLDNGDFKKAINFYSKALALYHDINDKEGIAISNGNIAKTYNKLQEYDVAIEYGKKSLDFSQEIGSLYYEKNSDEYLSDAYEGKHDLKQALFHYKQVKLLNDSIFNLEKQKEITKMEAIYQNEKKEKEIEILEKDKKIEIAEIQKVQLQKYIFIAGFLLVILLTIVIFRSYKQKQKNNLERLKGKNDTLLIEINEQRQKHLSEVVNIQEKERKRIAENLHDELGGALSAIKVNLSSWMYQNQSQVQDNKLIQIESMVDIACTQVRTIAHDLMPPELAKLGFNYAIESLVDKMDQNGKIIIHLSNELAEKQLKPEIEIAVYRIINELLTNTLRHSKAQNASLQLFISDGFLTIIAEDNGIGFDSNTMGAGMGLGNTKSRIAALNGSITIDSAPNRGSSILIDIPFIGD